MHYCYHHSITAAKSDSEALLDTLLGSLYSNALPMSSAGLDAAVDHITLHVAAHFRKLAAAAINSGATAAAAEAAIAELTARINSRCDRVVAHHSLLRAALEHSITAVQRQHVQQFIASLSAMQLPMPESRLLSEVRALRRAITAKLRTAVNAVVRNTELQQELPLFKAALSDCAFANCQQYRELLWRTLQLTRT
jgi:hypothetical protein